MCLIGFLSEENQPRYLILSQLVQACSPSNKTEIMAVLDRATWLSKTVSSLGDLLLSPFSDSSITKTELNELENRDFTVLAVIRTGELEKVSLSELAYIRILAAKQNRYITA